MKKTVPALMTLLLFLCTIPGTFGASPKQNTCLTCHTNGEILKSLYKPPAMEVGEAGEGRAGVPPPVKAEEMYRGFLVDGEILKQDPHFLMGCKFCHQGDPAAGSREAAHRGLVKRPSDKIDACIRCHKEIGANYSKALHYTTVGQKNGIRPRFSPAEAKHFDDKVFEASCRSCHAACGDCHVKGPPVGGISIGLISGHRFVRKNEGKTCAFCHGGGVYSEFTGDYGGNADVHYEKGMMCMDCHKGREMHGDGTAYAGKQKVKDRPSCIKCHDKLGQETLLTTRIAHTKHRDKVTCQGCHSAGEYRHCYSCHIGTGATSKPGMVLGLNPRDGKTLTTLRLIPTVRDTFAKDGIRMENFDALPNYRDSPVHNIRKRTDRTRSCDACHVDRKGFLFREMLPEKGSKLNEGLIVIPRKINR